MKIEIIGHSGPETMLDKEAIKSMGNRRGEPERDGAMLRDRGADEAKRSDSVIGGPPSRSPRLDRAIRLT